MTRNSDFGTNYLTFKIFGDNYSYDLDNSLFDNLDKVELLNVVYDRTCTTENESKVKFILGRNGIKSAETNDMSCTSDSNSTHDFLIGV